MITRRLFFARVAGLFAAKPLIKLANTPLVEEKGLVIKSVDWATKTLTMDYEVVMRGYASSKTAALATWVEKSLQRGQPVMIHDGKESRVIRSMGDFWRGRP